MHSAFGFSGRLGRVAYGYLTLGFSTLVFVLATPTGAPFTQLMTDPWTVIARTMDGMIQIGGNHALIADAFVSLIVAGLGIWAFSVMTVCRLRDIGQSPWWTVLVLFSGNVVPAMVVLALIPPARTAVAKSSQLTQPQPVIAASGIAPSR